MSQPFTFPPPPPPPPKQSSNQNSYPLQNGRGGQRGRGGFSNFQQNNRGGSARGHYSQRGSQRGGYSNRGHGVNQSGTGQSSYNRNNWNSNQAQVSSDRRQDDSQIFAQKRPHSVAFNNQSTPHVAKQRPSAPPAVPSFGINFDTLLPNKTEPQSTAVPVSKKANLLGLTPAAQNPDSGSEDDHEEESKLAGAFANSDVLQFEYRGETSSLKTPEEVAAWIAERRKKWPTEAKREVAQREAEERKKKNEAERAARLEASKVAAKAKQEERRKQRLEKEKSLIRQRLLREQIQRANTKTAPRTNSTIQNAAQMKAEKLKRKAQKIAQQLSVAEEALAQQEQGTSLDQTQDEDELGNMNDIDALVAQVDRIAAAQQDPTSPDFPSLNLDLDASDTSINSDSDSDPAPETDAPAAADDTSTSGSSPSSDSDSGPEQSSSKHAPPPTKPTTSTPNDTRPLCTNFAKTGRCKFGRRCHFRHDKADRKALHANQVAGADGRRKGLYQVMVEKEKEAERKRALRVIIALGEAGVLDEEGPEGSKKDKDSGQ